LDSGDTFFFIEKRHPAEEMGEEEIAMLFQTLAVNRRVSASTQTVALSACLFLIETC